MPDEGRKKSRIEPQQLIFWATVIAVLYLISLNNYLLFHSLIELFSILVAYMIFLIAWKSKTVLENRYLLFIGIAYLFIGSIDLLHTLAYRGMGVFPEFDTNLPTQLWIAGRFLESASLFAAPMLFTQSPGNGWDNWRDSGRKSRLPENDSFARKALLVYAGVTAVFLVSIFSCRNFPDCFIEGSGLTPFKIASEYIISLMLIFSLVLLYGKRSMFEYRIFRMLAAAIILTILGELAFTFYINAYGFSNLMGHYFKLLSFYLIYKAIVETGFEEPHSILFRELKQREETFRQEAIFLEDDRGHIYRMLGVQKSPEETKLAAENPRKSGDRYNSFLQNFRGIGFQLDRDFAPTFIYGAVEEIAGYSKENFLSGDVEWIELVIPEDRQLILEKRRKLESDPELSTEMEYRIREKNGEIRWVREIIQNLPGSSGTPKQFQGSIHDITERKMAEEALTRIDKIRVKEIHHRIKNNLQVISSLLSLQAEKFGDEEVLEAFRESQNRVISMAVIHEELYKGDEIDTLDFAAYLRKLTADLLRSYMIGEDNISLKMDLEKINLGMDSAIPLGIIVNELVSNSLRHAFTKEGGEIHIKLAEENNGKISANPGSSGGYGGCGEEKDVRFTLTVSDNGKGIPEGIDFRDPDSLGLQLVNILVEQIEGSIEFNNGHGTEFMIQFADN